MDDNTPEVTPEPETNPMQAERDALYNKNQELLNDLAGLKQFKRQVEELGGIETITSLATAAKDAEQQKLEANNDIAQLKEHFNSEIEAERTKNNQLVTSIVDNHIDTQLRSAVTKNKGSYELLDAKLRTQVTGEFVNGKVQLSIKDANGMPMLVNGADATINDLVESYKSDDTYARAFDAVADVTGSGAPTSGKVAIAPEAQTLAELSALYKKNPGQALEAMKAKGITI